MIAPYLYLHLDSHLTRHVGGVLSEVFPDYEVELGEAHWLPGRGLQLRRVALSQKSPAGVAAETVFVDELFLHTQADLADLALGDKQIRRLSLHGLRVSAIERSDGAWSTAGLWPLPDLGGKPEQIDVHGGRFAVVTVDAQGRRRSVELRDCDFSAHRQPGSERWRVEASAAAAWCSRVSAVAVLDEASGRAGVNLQAEGLAWSGELVERLPERLAEKLKAVRPLAAEIDCRAAAEFDLQRGALGRWQVSGTMTDGLYSPPQLATPIHDVEMSFRADRSGGEVSAATAWFGDASVSGSAGWKPNGDFHVAGSVERLFLTSGLLDAVGKFTPKAVQLKEDYQPEGLVDVEFTLASESGRLSQSLSAKCRDLSVTCRQFPYPVDHVTGTVDWSTARLQVSLEAFAGNQPIHVHADVASPGRNGFGRVEISGASIPISDELLSALRDDQQHEIARLHPAGKFDFFYRLEKLTPESQDDTFIRLAFRDSAVAHEAFPYPLTGLRGVVELRDGRWVLGVGEPLLAEAGDGMVRCRGEIAPRAESRGDAPLLRLAFAAERIALDRRLYDALPDDSQARWDELRPAGAVDFEADFLLATAETPPSLAVRGRLGRHSVSIYPQSFPYRLERLEGSVDLRNGKTSWRGVRGFHGETRVRCDGAAEVSEAGRDRIVLRNLMLDWNGRDRELVEALPEQLRDAIVALNPRGVYHVAGTLSLEPALEEDPFEARWSLNIVAVNAALSCGVELTNVFGRLEQFTGRSSGELFSASGRLTASSVDYWGHQFKQIDGPIDCNVARVQIGAGATARSSADPLRAKLYDGVVEGFATYEWSTRRYAVDAKLDNADLGRLGVEHLPGRQSLLGKADATLKLRGAGAAVAGVSGQGSIHLRDADIYELPVMVSLLKLLSVRPPDATAFTESHIDYAIQGSTIRFPKIEFIGDAVSLDGDGALRLPDQIDLVFSARLGRRPAPLIGMLLDGKGEPWRLMPVRVYGSLYDPDVSIEAFPAFNDALAPTADRDARPQGGAGLPRIGRLSFGAGARSAR